MSNKPTFYTSGIELDASEATQMALEPCNMPDGYEIFPDGICQMPTEGTDVPPILICTPLRVTATFSDKAGKGWGKMISVRNGDGTWNDIPVLNEQIERFPSDVIGQLADAGLELAPDGKSKQRVLTLIKSWKPDTRMFSVARMGWVDETHSSFVAGDAVIGEAKVLSLIKAPAGLIATGSTDAWKQTLGEKCRGNPNMILAVCLAFAGPLLSILGTGGGGLHFRGASSKGKTTLLNLAASVWGSPQLITQWRATSNGLEGVAAGKNDMLLALDEIAGIGSRVLPEAIYMLANGVGKSRMTRAAKSAEPARWHISLISSGEISIEEKLKEAGARHMAGQEVRLIDIEADTGRYGAFDDLHGATNGAAFADQIKKAAKENHGVVGRAFVTKLIKLISADKASALPGIVERFRNDAMSKLSGTLEGQVSRVAYRFAVLALAGELATKWGLTGWEALEANKVSMDAFVDWHDRRFGSKNEYLAKVVVPLQRFLAANMNAIPQVGTTLPAGSKLGWRDEDRIYLSKDCWHQLFPGVQATDAAKALIEAGLMVPGDGRQMCKGPRAIPGRPRFHTLNRDKVMGYKLA